MNNTDRELLEQATHLLRMMYEYRTTDSFGNQHVCLDARDENGWPTDMRTLLETFIERSDNHNPPLV